MRYEKKKKEANTVGYVCYVNHLYVKVHTYVCTFTCTR